MIDLITQKQTPQPGPFNQEYPGALQELENSARGGRDWGLALSGGGIRSATFCLGFLQSLAKHNLLSRIGFLSTVSGGGYIGGFLGSLFSRPEARDKKSVTGVLLDPRSFPMDWLRENGRYLAPNGSGDLMAALAVMIRNWISVLIVITLVLLVPFFLINAVRAWLSDIPLIHLWLSIHFHLPGPDGFWWNSPVFALVLVPLYFAVALGWSYWLVARYRQRRATNRPWAYHLGLVVIVAGALVYIFANLELEPMDKVELLSFGSLPLSAFAIHGLTWGWARRFAKENPDAKPGLNQGQSTDWQRRKLSTSLASALTVVGVFLVLGTVDSLGQSLFLTFQEEGLSASVNTFLAAIGASALFSMGPKLMPLLPRAVTEKLRGAALTIIASVTSLLAILTLLLTANVVVQAVSWEGTHPADLQFKMSSTAAVMGLVAATVLTFLAGRAVLFLHTSSLQMLYGFRLARAYLGASNPNRKEHSENRAVTEMVPGDDIWLRDYRPHENQGPIHLINLTFNETCSAKSNIEQRDRKGLQFAVGPFGISVGRNHHALWHRTVGGQIDDTLIEPLRTVADPKTTFAIFPPLEASKPHRDVENLSVGHWLALSGAAIGTGLGSRTSLSLSLLAGFANIRLGYWWDSRIKPDERPRSSRTKEPCFSKLGRLLGRAFPVQSYMLDEWLARFHGPARPLWHLSDGGHFENTAVYELLRRRVPRIICCDCGQDPHFHFGDLANLVRKAKLDFQANISFFTRHELDSLKSSAKDEIPGAVRKALATPEEISQTQAKQRAHTGKAHGRALLARVHYTDPPDATSLILFVKPALTGDEPLDVLEYGQSNPEFPHQSTVDQFFDEAQWESYRQLGEHSGDSLFGSSQGFDGSAGLQWFTNLPLPRHFHRAGAPPEPFKA